MLPGCFVFCLFSFAFMKLLYTILFLLSSCIASAQTQSKAQRINKQPTTKYTREEIEPLHYLPVYLPLFPARSYNKRRSSRILFYELYKVGLTGTVTDVKGKPIKGARVSLISDTANCTTQSDGSYCLQAPEDVVFELAVSCKGYKLSQTRTMTIEDRKVFVTDFTLRRKWWQSKK